MKVRILFYCIFLCGIAEASQENIVKSEEVAAKGDKVGEETALYVNLDHAMYQTPKSTRVYKKKSVFDGYRFINFQNFDSTLSGSQSLSNSTIQVLCVDRINSIDANKMQQKSIDISPTIIERRTSLTRRFSAKLKRRSFKKQNEEEQEKQKKVNPLVYLNIKSSDIVCLSKDDDKKNSLSDVTPLFYLDRVQEIMNWVQKGKDNRTSLPWVDGKTPFLNIIKLSTGKLHITEHSSVGMTPHIRKQALKTVSAIAAAAQVNADQWTLERNNDVHVVYASKTNEEVSQEEAVTRIMAGNAQETLDLKVCVYLKNRD